MKIENLINLPKQTFALKLASVIRVLLKSSGCYEINDMKSGNGSHMLVVTDREDGQRYRVYLEPEIHALQREEQITAQNEAVIRFISRALGGGKADG